LWNIDGADFTICPKGLVKDEAWIGKAFDWYRHYKNGMLPNKGGLLDQQQRYLTVMELIDLCINRIKAEEADSKPRRRR
jgi:hypothetical protein